MKYMICSHARSGKDNAAEFIHEKTGLSFLGSSFFAAEEFIYDTLKEEYGYTSVENCFSRRYEPGMRVIWYNLIAEYNKEDPIRLVKNIFASSDVYVGLRSYYEMEAAKKYYGNEIICIWIDAEGRVPDESADSMTITKEQADIIIENKQGVEEFNAKLEKLCNLIGSKK
mgnify:CR=1 FL=1